MSETNVNVVLEFAGEPLDEKDRQIMIALKEAGTGGLGFNALVKKLQPEVSRSTVAVRVEKLLRLGYLEKKQNGRAGKLTPIYLSKRAQQIFAIIDKSRELSNNLIQKLDELDELDLGAFENWLNEFREKFNALFGMTAVVAVFYGASAAGDIFLPFLLDDYRNLFNKFTKIIKDKPEALKTLRSWLDSKRDIL
jgi:DNA-binding Lrp family transcriptional regulator